MWGKIPDGLLYHHHLENWAEMDVFIMLSCSCSFLNAYYLHQPHANFLSRYLETFTFTKHIYFTTSHLNK